MAADVPVRDKVGYFVVGAVLFVVFGYAAGWLGPVDRSWLHLYEGVVVSVVTFAGAYRVAESYPSPIDGPFFEMAYLLSVPLLIKTTLAGWVAIYGGSWLFSAILPYVSADSAESAHALSYWLGRAWQIFPFLVAVAITMLYWYRLAHHVAYVVAKRGA